MYKYFILMPVLVFTLSAYSQSYLDKKITVSVADTNNIYQRVRIAFGKNDFQVKEDGNYSILTTLPRALKKTPGFVIGRAEIKGNDVIITGIYGLSRIDDWGYTRTPKDWKDVMYMKGSKTFPLLENVAKKLDGKISYSK